MTVSLPQQRRLPGRAGNLLDFKGIAARYFAAYRGCLRETEQPKCKAGRPYLGLRDLPRELFVLNSRPSSASVKPGWSRFSGSGEATSWAWHHIGFVSGGRQQVCGPAVLLRHLGQMLGITTPTWRLRADTPVAESPVRSPSAGLRGAGLCLDDRAPARRALVRVLRDEGPGQRRRLLLHAAAVSTEHRLTHRARPLSSSLSGGCSTDGNPEAACPGDSEPQCRPAIQTLPGRRWRTRLDGQHCLGCGSAPAKRFSTALQITEECSNVLPA